MKVGRHTIYMPIFRVINSDIGFFNGKGETAQAYNPIFDPQNSDIEPKYALFYYFLLRSAGLFILIPCG